MRETKKGIGWLLLSLLILAGVGALLWWGISFLLPSTAAYEKGDIPLNAVDTVKMGETAYTLSTHVRWQDCFALEQWERAAGEVTGSPELFLSAGEDISLQLGDGWLYAEDAWSGRASLYTVPQTVLPAVKAYIREHAQPA